MPPHGSQKAKWHPLMHGLSRWKTTQCVMMGKERPRREVPPKLHPGKSLSFREFLIPTLLTHSFHYSKSNSCNWSRTQVPCSGLVWCHVYLFLTKMKLFFRVKLFLGMKLFWYKGETVCQDVSSKSVAVSNHSGAQLDTYWQEHEEATMVGMFRP